MIDVAHAFGLLEERTAIRVSLVQGTIVLSQHMRDKGDKRAEVHVDTDASARGLRICVDAPLSIYARAPCLFLRCVLLRCSFLGRRSVLSLKASKRSAREFRGASCLPNANSVQGKSKLSLEGSGECDSCLTNSLERDKKTGAPELNAGCGHLSSSVQNQAAAYPSSRRPTFDGGRSAGMGTGSNAGSRCHGRPRLSNPGQPFS